MTYETDGGYPLNRRREDGTISTLRDGIAHHYTASLATLETAAGNRRARLLDYYDFRRSAMDEARADRMKRVVLAPAGDARMLGHVVGLLLRNGIEVTRLKQPATSSVAHAYWGGAAARGPRVPLQQRQRSGCPARVRPARRRVQGGDRHAAAPGRRRRVSARHVRRPDPAQCRHVARSHRATGAPERRPGGRGPERVPGYDRRGRGLGRRHEPARAPHRRCRGA